MKTFRKLDIFKKVPKDLSEGTNLGGLISIGAIILIAYFIVSQVIRFVSPPNVASIRMDDLMTRKQMTVNLHIQFPRFPCELLSLDLQDAMMSHIANVKQIKKYRQNAAGQIFQSEDFQLLREPDVEKQYKMAEFAFKQQYGCRIKGQFKVKEVPGNFHISSHPYSYLYNMLMESGVIKTLDVSHKIHYLYFGQISNIYSVKAKHPGSELTPLNGHYRIYNMSYPYLFTSHYHLDIVPTLYDEFFTNVRAYQYAYMHNTFSVNHMPSLYFNYHIGGTNVSITPSSWRFSTFILNLCAVIGGIYALAHFLYNSLFALLDKKIGYQELGR